MRRAIRDLAIVIGLLPYTALADPIVHYFAGSFAAQNGGLCRSLVCEKVKESGTDFFGFFSFDSEAEDLAKNEPLRGNYQSEGIPFGFSIYLEIADTWIFTTGVDVTFLLSKYPQFPNDYQDGVAVRSLGAVVSDAVESFNFLLHLCYSPGTLSGISPQGIPGLGDSCSLTGMPGFRASALSTDLGGGDFWVGRLTKIVRVAEPSSIALIALGLVGIWSTRRKRCRQSANFTTRLPLTHGRGAAR